MYVCKAICQAAKVPPIGKVSIAELEADAADLLGVTLRLQSCLLSLLGQLLGDRRGCGVSQRAGALSGGLGIGCIGFYGCGSGRPLRCRAGVLKLTEGLLG